MITKNCEICGKPIECFDYEKNGKVSHFKCAFASCEEIRKKIVPESEAYYKQFMK